MSQVLQMLQAPKSEAQPTRRCYVIFPPLRQTPPVSVCGAPTTLATSNYQRRRFMGDSARNAPAGPVAGTPAPQMRRSRQLVAVPAWGWRTLETFAALAISAAALWLAARPELHKPQSPPFAPWVLGAIAIVTGCLVIWLRRHSGLDRANEHMLPDPLFPLYLATAILVGAFGCVLVAVLTPLAVSLLTRRLAPRSVSAVARQMATNACLMLIVGVSYVSVVVVFARILPTRLYAHVAAAALATVIALGGVFLLQSLRSRTTFTRQTDHLGSDDASARAGRPHPLHALYRSLTTGMQVYLRDRAFRYQVLLFSIGPLLPFAEALDDANTELAWLVFLVPLCGIYYLAVQGVQLQQKSTQLEKTVTQLRASQLRTAELQGYAALVTQAQEDERRRLARDLHDDTAQTLVALARGLDAFAPAVAFLPPQVARPSGTLTPIAAPTPTNPLAPGADAEADGTADNTRYLEELRGLTQRALESVRRACQDLRPSVLDDLGLPAALESLATITTRRGLSCTFAQHGVAQTYPSPVEVAVYRITQEALTNVRRHSQATQAYITLTYDDDALRLTVRDNGVGFDPATDAPLAASEEASEAPKTPTRGELGLPGLGLLGMRERAALIGGTIEICSQPGDGASVILSVPAAAIAPEA